MKKFLSIILIIIASFTLASCGGGNTVTIGVLSQANISAKDYSAKYTKALHIKNIKFEYKYYNNCESMIKALNSKKIDFASTNEKVAEYILSNNEELDYLPYGSSPNIEYGLCFNEENIEVLNMINGAIRDMKKDGTLEKLTKSYILDAIDGESLDPVSLPTLNTDISMTIAVTGDMPPFDMVDGKDNAVGFNMALLSEISKRININIKVVHVDYKDRFKALEDDKCDGVFVALTEKSSDAILKYRDIPELAICSEPYFTGKEVLLYNLDNEKTINRISQFAVGGQQ